ncbi:hypothetical protein HanOQP8_Chr17g0668011 [Helianthus annuus]|nr:hypothetical protein HanOQP8_Chr17g0668011 [Helianthus annuus]
MSLLWPGFAAANPHTSSPCVAPNAEPSLPKTLALSLCQGASMTGLLSKSTKSAMLSLPCVVRS